VDQLKAVMSEPKIGNFFDRQLKRFDIQYRIERA